MRANGTQTQRGIKTLISEVDLIQRCVVGAEEEDVRRSMHRDTSWPSDRDREVFWITDVNQNKRAGAAASVKYHT